MGLNIGKALKRVGKAVGKVASFAPGPIGMMGSAVSAAASGKPIGKSILGDMTRNSKVAATLLPVAMTGGAAAGALGAGGGALGGAAAGGGKLAMLGKLGGFAMDNADLLLGGLAGYQGYQADKKADKLRQQQMDLAMQRWNETAPLRKLGQSQMLDQTREDLYPTYRNAANPFG